MTPGGRPMTPGGRHELTREERAEMRERNRLAREAHLAIRKVQTEERLGEILKELVQTNPELLQDSGDAKRAAEAEAVLVAGERISKLEATTRQASAHWRTRIDERLGTIVEPSAEDPGMSQEAVKRTLIDAEVV